MEKIKSKLAVIAGSTFIALLMMAALLHFSSHRVSELQETRVKVTEVRAGMLMLRRNEKDFIMRNNLKYRDKFEDNYQTLTQDIQSLRDNMALFGLNMGEVDRLSEALSSYRQQFLSLITLTETVGLNESSGLHGQLRNVIHRVENTFTQQNDTDLLSQVLTLRKNEKDFIQRRTLKYQEKFTSNLSRLTKAVSSSSLPQAQKQQLLIHLEDYRKGFFQLIQGYQQKGLTPDTGLQGEMRHTVHQTEDLLSSLLKDADAQLNSELLLLRGLGLTLALVLAGVLSSSILVIMRQIVKPINLAVLHMQDIAEGEGDLSVRLKDKGRSELAQMGRSFNTFVGKISDIIVTVSQQAQGIATTAEESATISEQNNAAARKQQDATQQAAAAVDQMVATIELTAENIHKAADAASHASNEAQTGSARIHTAVNKVESLARDIDQATYEVNALAQNSLEIQSILEVIRGVAEQTNLLALNAAIEAARAGESGRGFAVVADEVRTLAQRTQDSTEDIQQTTEQLSNSVEKVIKVINRTNKEAVSSVALISEAGEAFDHIRDAIQTISDMNAQIANISEEESASAREIQNSICSIFEVSSECALSAQASAQESEELARIAIEMNELVHQFKF